MCVCVCVLIKEKGFSLPKSKKYIKEDDGSINMSVKNDNAQKTTYQKTCTGCFSVIGEHVSEPNFSSHVFEPNFSSLICTAFQKNG